MVVVVVAAGSRGKSHPRSHHPVTNNDDPRMDSHPKEIVVFWASRHGNEAITGTAQRPRQLSTDFLSFLEWVWGLACF